ncbi:Meiotic activator RIM4 [Cladobotryum mycophilum]|uniref:Meiotic activator RIM4 n=1 Tax=Cladobotryum mycophilum TaxID=491253 RepID=A0ABR0T4R7_9HYPO
MAPMITVSDRPKKILVKSASLEHFVRESSSSSEDEERGGGARLSNGSIMLSPETRRLAQRPSSSGMAEPRPSGSSAFQVGTTQDDDVFTETVKTEENDDESTVEIIISPINEGASSSSKEEETSQSLVPMSPVHIDAQNIYPPTACIFAANLPAAFDDYKLEMEVTKFFSQFGTVFVKIRRDSRQMPFAFCQFTRDEDAQQAEQQSTGAKILGRPVRIEMAKANSSWIVHKLSGKEITKQEAVSLLGMLGEIAGATHLDEKMRAQLNLPPSIVVQFRLYDPKRDVLRSIGKHRIYKVRPYDQKGVDPKVNPRRHDDDQMMAQYDRDRRSAFFGNLPLNMTEVRLSRLASAWGSVIGIELKRKHVPSSHNRSVEICFAFVEFMRPDSADDVVNAFNGTNLDGYTIKVQRKQSRLFETPRRGQHQDHPQTPYAQSSAQHRRSGSTYGHQRPISYGGNFAARDTRSFTSPAAAAYAGAEYTSAPNAYARGPYHHAARHASHASVSSVVSAGPAPPESPDAASDRTTTPKATKSEPSEEANVKTEDQEIKPSDSEDDGKTIETNIVDVKGKGKAIATSPPAAASKSAAHAVAASPGGYPMMTPAMSPYGYTPMHPLMHHPLTPQGPVFYPNGYSGYNYSPMPTPMEAMMYSQYLDSMMAPYRMAETPTRPTGSFQQGGKGESSKNVAKTPSATKDKETKSNEKPGAQDDKGVKGKGKELAQ